jgi:prevent-host-death family protein
MARYSVVEAKNRLSALIDAAEAGEDVVITRHGKPAAVVRPVDSLMANQDPAEWSKRRDETLEMLHRLRESLPRMEMSSVELIRQMRDEGP